MALIYLTYIMLSFLTILGRILHTLLVLVPILIAVAFFTVTERQILSAIQRRQGPNAVGISGLFQALADAAKLLVKETIIPASSNKLLFLGAPRVTFVLALTSWSVVPVSEHGGYSDPDLGILFLLALSSFAVYGVLIAGWASNSKYAFRGGLRSAAQIVSYEVSIGFLLVSVVLCSGTLNLTSIVKAQTDVWYSSALIPVIVLFFVSLLAETNRHPFDLPEAEAELVSGYNVEYSAAGFVLFFIGEYANIVLISVLISILFFGGWISPVGIFSGSLFTALKTLVFIALFILARAAYPRFRYDQLIRLGWKVFLPRSIGFLLGVAILLWGINGLPHGLSFGISSY
jgi:NADH-quinone oxidoreductase subunit H